MNMLLDRGVSAGVSHIRLQEVVRRAQLTTGAAYRLWADQEDFHQELAAAFTRWRTDPPMAEVRGILDSLEPDRAKSWEEVIRLTAAAHVRSISGDDLPSRRHFMIALALRASAHGSEDLSRASVERHLESVAEFADFYGVLMRSHGYRMRAPLTVDDFAAAVAALGEGFCVQAIQGISHPTFNAEGTDAEAEVSLAGGEWTLFAIAVRALVDGMMICDQEAGGG